MIGNIFEYLVCIYYILFNLSNSPIIIFILYIREMIFRSSVILYEVTEPNSGRASTHICIVLILQSLF